MPLVYGDTIKPVLSCSSLFLWQDVCREPECKRLYLGRCSSCYEEDMRFDSRLDVFVCVYCGETSVYEQVNHFTMTTRQQDVARKFNPDFHKRIAHFRHWLKRLQGKERNTVTAEILTNIKRHIRNQNVRGVHYWTVRNALRELGLQRYYNNTVSIMCAIRGKPLFNLNRAHERELVDMFVSLQSVFGGLENKRVNMLSYPFVIKKLCEIKGWTSMAKVIPTLKSNTRIIAQDELWRTICIQCKWKFIPTSQWLSLDSRSRASRPR